jgi:hypothetical protein
VESGLLARFDDAALLKVGEVLLEGRYEVEELVSFPHPSPDAFGDATQDVMLL